jgi:hypothetical protein
MIDPRLNAGNMPGNWSMAAMMACSEQSSIAASNMTKSITAGTSLSAQCGKFARWRRVPRLSSVTGRCDN